MPLLHRPEMSASPSLPWNYTFGWNSACTRCPALCNPQVLAGEQIQATSSRFLPCGRVHPEVTPRVGELASQAREGLHGEASGFHPRYPVLVSGQAGHCLLQALSRHRTPAKGDKSGPQLQIRGGHSNTRWWILWGTSSLRSQVRVTSTSHVSP